jgi:hypothetical protein
MLKLLAHHQPWRGIEIAIVTVNNAGDITSVAGPPTLKATDPGAMIAPTLAGPDAQGFLQSALEAAWEMGLRPKNWRLETTEQVAALNNHLEDMRALVFATPPATRIRPPSER